LNALIWIAGIIVIIAALFLFMRVHVCGTYSGEGPLLVIGIGPLTLLKLPRPPELRKASKKNKKRSEKLKKKIGQDQDQKPGGSLAGYWDMIPIVRCSLSTLRRMLCVDELTLRYCSADKDPARAAMLFGSASAVVGTLLQPLEELFRIKEREILTDISFTDTEPAVYVRVRISVSLGILLIIALRGYAQYRKIRKNTGLEDREES